MKEPLLTNDYQNDFLPIMFKVYEDGKLTSAIKRASFIDVNVRFSCPRGRGFELEDTRAGRVIIVAGGTGLYPFSDLIDLLFKTALIEENHKMKGELLQADPILRKKPFEKFKFVFMIAINEPEDIHPITFSQLVKLSANQEKFKITIRVSKNGEKLQT